MHSGTYFFASIAAFFISYTFHCQALIPIKCARNVTKFNAVCCPVNKHNMEICGGPHRGECSQINVFKEFIPKIFHIDDRINFPTAYFKYACQCKGNYFGVSCEDCWFGWKGKKCNKRTTHTRYDIRSLSQKDLDIFKKVIVASQTWPSKFVGIDETNNWHVDPLKKPKLYPLSVQHWATYMHRYTSRSTLFKDQTDCKEYGILDFSHDGVIFATWHRYFGLLWERMLAKIAYKLFKVKKFAIPYWDWVGLQNCDICTNQYIGAPGKRGDDGLHLSDKSPFYNLTEFCPEPEDESKLCYGCRHNVKLDKITREFKATEFATHEDVKYLMGLKNYWTPGDRTSSECKSFHMALEGYCGKPKSSADQRWFHNKLHVMIDGSMCCAGTATNDPLFLLHHAFIDKIFDMWIYNHKPSIKEYPYKHVRPGHGRLSFATGLFPLVKVGDMFTPSTKLGYKYDDSKVGKYSMKGPMDLKNIDVSNYD